MTGKKHFVEDMGKGIAELPLSFGVGVENGKVIFDFNNDKTIVLELEHVKRLIKSLEQCVNHIETN